ncbi:hypothetical protein G4D82_06040 [Flavobacterium sp. CYK-4]|nr:hypothetical protein [Flavobacterium lotistagni]
MKVRQLLLGTFIFLIGISSYGQCAMCRAALEGEGNIKKAEAVNDGIVYLMMIPYILVGAIGIFIFRMYRKRKS